MNNFSQSYLYNNIESEKDEILFMQKVNDYIHNSSEGIAYGELCKSLFNAAREKASELAKLDAANQENPFYTDRRLVNKMDLNEYSNL